MVKPFLEASLEWRRLAPSLCVAPSLLIAFSYHEHSLKITWEIHFLTFSCFYTPLIVIVCVIMAERDSEDTYCCRGAFT